MPDRSKIVCTETGMTMLKNFLNRTIIIELCRRDRERERERERRGVNTKWKFNKLTKKLRFFASLKNVPMGCREALLSETVLVDQTVGGFTFGENTRRAQNGKLCNFGALALHLHCNHKPEEKGKCSIYSSQQSNVTNVINFILFIKRTSNRSRFFCSGTFL